LHASSGTCALHPLPCVLLTLTDDAGPPPLAASAFGLTLWPAASVPTVSAIATCVPRPSLSMPPLVAIGCEDGSVALFDGVSSRLLIVQPFPSPIGAVDFIHTSEQVTLVVAVQSGDVFICHIQVNK
jgi:hypothetical protein